MRKAKYFFLFITSIIFLVGCLKAPKPIPGPQGKTGPQGPPAGNLTGVLTDNQSLLLNSSTVTNGAAPYYYALWKYTGYNPAKTYMLTVYVQKNDSTVWYKLPIQNIYAAKDQLSASLSNDSVKIYYTSKWPAKAVMNCQIFIVPQQ